MQSSPYQIDDVLIASIQGVEQPVKVCGYVDGLDDTKPLYVNVRVADGQRWGERRVKIMPSQIIRADPEWYERQHAAWEASIKETADRIWAKLTPAQRQAREEEAKRLRRRSLIDIMIDRAVGLE